MNNNLFIPSKTDGLAKSEEPMFWKVIDRFVSMSIHQVEVCLLYIMLQDEEVINRFVILYKAFLELNKNQMTHPRIRQVSKFEEGLTEPKELSMAKIETPEISESKREMMINSQRKAILSLISDDEFLVNLTVANKKSLGLPAKTMKVNFRVRFRFANNSIELIGPQEDLITASCSQMVYEPLGNMKNKSMCIVLNKFHLDYCSIRLTLLQGEVVIERFVTLPKSFLKLHKNKMTFPGARKASKKPCEPDVVIESEPAAKRRKISQDNIDLVTESNKETSDEEKSSILK
uniref:SPK domain-containing protein n=1 Tax=Caenorhabditis tropicalis TaxID=1561998 RepID=A0A1I7TT38_9PELO